MMLRRIFALVLALLSFSFVACDDHYIIKNGSEDMSDSMFLKDGSDSESFFLRSDSLGSYYIGQQFRISCTRFIDDALYVYGFDHTSNQYIVRSYDRCGTLLSSEHCDFGYIDACESVAFTAERELLCLTYDETSGTAQLVLYDHTGTRIREGTPFHSDHGFSDVNPHSLQIFEDGSILWFRDGDVVLFHSFNAEPRIYELPHLITDADPLPDGTFLLYCREGTLGVQHNFYTFYPESGETVDYVPDDVGTVPRMLFGYSDTPTDREWRNLRMFFHDGEFYLFDADALSVYRDGSVTRLIHWEHSDMDGTAITVYDTAGNDCFVAEYNNALNLNADIVLLYETKEQRNQPRTVIRIASIGTGEQNNLMDALVRQFNAENADYMAELYDYDAYYDPELHGYTVLGTSTPTEINRKKFEEDLLAGITYDIYIMPPQSEEYSLLAEKHLLSDMTPYVADLPVFDGVKNACRQGEQTLAVPFYMRLDTLVTADTVLPHNISLTWDVLYDIAENIGIGESLFGNAVFENLKIIGLRDFVDTDTKTCSIDSPKGIDYLTFLNEVKAGLHTDETLAVVYEDAWESSPHFSHFYFSSEEAMDTRTQNRVKLSRHNLKTPEAIAAMYMQFDGQEIHFCGYPSENAPAVVLSSDMMVSFSLRTSSLDGAVAFLSYLYTDAIQTCELLSEYGLPVTRSALRQIFPIGNLEFYNDYHGYRYEKENPNAINVDYALYDFDDTTQRYVPDVYAYLQITEDDFQSFLKFLSCATWVLCSDSTTEAIFDEEFSYLESGVRSAAETARVLQGRINIYINE